MRKAIQRFNLPFFEELAFCRVRTASVRQAGGNSQAKGSKCFRCPFATPQQGSLNQSPSFHRHNQPGRIPHPQDPSRKTERLLSSTLLFPASHLLQLILLRGAQNPVRHLVQERFVDLPRSVCRRGDRDDWHPSRAGNKGKTDRHKHRHRDRDTDRRRHRDRGRHTQERQRQTNTSRQEERQKERHIPPTPPPKQ